MIVDGGPIAVIVVNAIIWCGLGLYLLRLGRHLLRLGRQPADLD